MNLHACGDGSKWQERFWSLVDKSGECWIWKGHIDPTHGYGRIWVARLPGVRWLAHRLAWKLTHGRIPRHLDLLHRCDNPPCVRPEHMFLGTHHDNMADAARKGRSACGERHPKSKFTADEVRKLRSEYKRGVRGKGYRSLAKKYGVTQLTISRIVNEVYWKSA